MSFLVDGVFIMNGLGRRLFFVVFSFLVLALSFVSASSVDVSSVFLNGVDVSDSVLFSVVAGSKLDVSMGVSSSVNVDRLEFQASIAGFSLSDSSHNNFFESDSVSNMRSNVVYPVSFSFVVPRTVDVGRYSVSVSVWDRSGIVLSKDISFVVVAGSDSGASSTSQVSNPSSQVQSLKSQVSLDLPVSIGSVVAGDDFSFSVRVSNSDSVTQSLKLSVDGIDSIGDISVSPSLIVVPSLSSESVRVSGVVDDDNFGERIFFVRVSSLDGSVSNSVPVSVDITMSFWKVVRSVLEVVLVVLVIVLLVFIFVIAWRNRWF